MAMTLARVIEAPRHFVSPVDPIEWQLRRDRSRARLAELATRAPDDGDIESVLLAGPPAEELSGWAHENGATLLALARRGASREAGLGSTAQRLLDKGSESLLLVPPSDRAGRVRYRRVLVPVDGSARAESVLPVAVRIARKHGAELVLAHVVPRLEVVDESHVPQLHELCSELASHNERNARTHLEALRGQFVGNGLAVRTVVAGPGDPRTWLRRIALEQQADLIVLSSHGRTGLEEVACGNVTEYLACHAPVPVLIVRPNLVCGFATDPVAGAESGTQFR